MPAILCCHLKPIHTLALTYVYLHTHSRTHTHTHAQITLHTDPRANGVLLDALPYIDFEYNDERTREQVDRLIAAGMCCKYTHTDTRTHLHTYIHTYLYTYIHTYMQAQI
jgi:hypothetical protein